MFPLSKRKIGGYSFGQRTFYGTKHTGTDYEANYVNYYAPFSGFASKGWGPEGGNYWTLVSSNRKFIARHLSKTLKVGQVNQGDLVAITGNTGIFTTKPHLHQEVYVDGKLIDPDKFIWEGKQMQLVFDKGTIYLVTGKNDKRKIGIADLQSLGLFGDEPQAPMDTSGIPQYQTIVKGQIKNN